MPKTIDQYTDDIMELFTDFQGYTPSRGLGSYTWDYEDLRQKIRQLIKHARENS